MVGERWERKQRSSLGRSLRHVPRGSSHSYIVTVVYYSILHYDIL